MPPQMKALFKLLLATPVVLFSPLLLAAEINLNAFLGANPLKDLDVELDGRVVGVTDSRGGLTADLEAGSHRVRLLKLDAALTVYEFQTAPGESADLSFTFTDFEQPALVAFDTFDAATGEGGAPGLVEGYVVDADGYAVPGATVRVEGSEVETVSDDNGAFRFEIARGNYTLNVTHPEHEPARQGGLRVLANVGIATQIALQPKVQEFGGAEASAVGGAIGAPDADIASEPAAPASETSFGADGVQEITVVGTFKPAQQTAVEVERFSDSVTSAISVDELLRFGDSDVAASLKRVVGISVSDGKYAVVRGLDGRYIAATLNGSLMPGTDPFRRDVQLDLFPSDILGGIEIQKNFSAELPGETTGGVIKMNTRGVPDEYINKFSFSLGYVDGVTGEDLGTYEGGDTDDFGFDDGFRDLPGAIDAASNGGLDFSVCQVQGQANCVEREEAGRLATLLPNVLNPEAESAAPNFGLSYSLGNVFDRDIGEVGLYGAVSYDRSSKARQDAFIDDNSVDTQYTRDQRNTTLSGYFVAGLTPASGAEYLSRTIVLRNTEDTVEVESGINKDEGTGLDRFLLEWEERQFLAQQFEGKRFLFGGDQRLSWRAGASQTRRDSPDRRSYRYINNSLALSTFERSYSELVEDGLDLGLDYELPLTLTPNIETKVTVGALGNLREREVDLARLGIRRGNGPNVSLGQDAESLFVPENFLADSFQLQQRTTDTDSYDGEQEAFAGYVSTKTDFGDAVTIVLGVRQDQFTQELSFPNDPGSESELDSDELLPSLLVTYRLTDALQFRGGYAGTVSRPNLTELAPSIFYDERGREFRGCPTCEASIIDNFDVRMEYYFADQDSISIAFFTKDIDDPLETALEDGSGSATDTLTFRNAEGATVSGIEIDGGYTFLDDAAHILSMGANMSFIDSEVDLDPLSQQLEIDPKRELQGQSPFLANLQVAWDFLPWGQKVTLLANYFDDRIDRITRGQPPIEEAGRLIVNFNYEKELFAQSKISFRVKNLLDESVEYTQGGRVIEGYDEGIEMSLGYSVNFN